MAPRQSCSPTDTAILELGGPGLAQWDVDELSVLTNMTVEGGLMTGIVEPCEPIVRFLQELWVLQHFYDSFAKGVLDTGHVAFYVIFLVVFLFWTVRIVESQRWR